MPLFTLTLNTREWEDALARLRQRVPAAVARALNRAGDSAVTAMVRVISQDTGVKQADLRGTTKRNRRIWTQPAVPGRERLVVYATAARLPLYDFGTTPKEPPSRGKGRGVTARLRGGAKRYPQAFIARMPSGHVGVFQRKSASLSETSRRLAAASAGRGKGPARLPIYELHGPSIAHVFEKHVKVGIQRGYEQLTKNLRSELRYAMRRTA